jgi:asparagine synthase (glutamine-hydrolysing)
VLLSGEGGDEAFGGYQSYRNFSWLEEIKGWLGPLAGPSGRVLTALLSGNGSRFGKYGSFLQTPLHNYYYTHSSGPHEFFNSDYHDLYTADFLQTIQQDSRAALVKQCFAEVSGLNALDQMLYVDTKTWLPDDLLVKADKMTMANSLELRVPLLDHQVLEFAASLPVSYKLKGVSTKHILKKALSNRLPSEILNRKKTGFPVPYSAWLNNEFRPLVSEVLLDERTVSRGYFNKKAIEAMLHSSSGRDYSKELFSLVTLELWHRTFLENDVVPL